MGSEKTGNQLEELKCILHAHREAVAKCPSCARFYCRECVVEHAGKMLCKSCLEKAASESATDKTSVACWIGSSVSVCISFLITVCAFYFLGKILLSIPEDFHESPTDFISDSVNE